MSVAMGTANGHKQVTGPGDPTVVRDIGDDRRRIADDLAGFHLSQPGEGHRLSEHRAALPFDAGQSA